MRQQYASILADFTKGIGTAATEFAQANISREKGVIDAQTQMLRTMVDIEKKLSDQSTQAGQAADKNIEDAYNTLNAMRQAMHQAQVFGR